MDILYIDKNFTNIFLKGFPNPVVKIRTALKPVKSGKGGPVKQQPFIPLNKSILVQVATQYWTYLN